jgi:2-amino-4-hydroxy-6-hydroxymethyldihydropteridine diphosphokinase
MHTAFILIGSNLGDRGQLLSDAQTRLTASGIEVVRQSSVYESEPWGVAGQPWFLNRVIEIKTDSTPEQLLDTLLTIESAMGRKREQKWGPRLIDLDILYFDELSVQSAALTIPHPGIPSRRFTLVPLVEMCAHKTHMPTGKTHQTLLHECEDPLQVRLFAQQH